MTFKSSFQKLSHAVLCALLVLFSGSGAAEDTEIYFSSGSSSGNSSNAVLPNVLFILDTSQSMTSDVPGTGQSRIQILKSAMNTILANLKDVNVGIMRFTYNTGGAVTYPVTNLDADDTSVIGEPTDAKYSWRLTTGTNDGQEDLTSHVVTLNGATLNMTQITAVTGGTFDFSRQASSSHHDAEEDRFGNMDLTNTEVDFVKNNTVGMRFYNVTIPQGATINSAYVDTYVKTQQGGSSSSTISVSVRVELTDNSPIITTGTQDITSRSFSSSGSAVTWNYPNSTANALVTSPDLKSLVQQVTDRAGWNSGQAILFRFTTSSTTQRQLYSLDGSSTKAPTLRINYTIPSIAGENNVVALRFPQVNIPQGSTVTGGSLVFTPQVNDSGSASWTISAEASDNSPVLAATASNLSGRTTTTASASWTVPNWSNNTAIETDSSVDISSILQEIVNRSGWCGGNAVTFLITGTGTRRAKAVEQASSDAPQLKYSYQIGSNNSGCIGSSAVAQIAATTDDAAETEGGGTDGAMNRSGATLVTDASNHLGLRFQNVGVPKNATITKAYLEFVAKQSNTGSGSKTIRGEAADNSAGFTTANGNISGRSMTSASVSWSPANWTSGITYSTFADGADLKTIVQEIVNRSGWASGNAMTFIISAASNTRGAKSYDNSAQDAARLYINYQTTSDQNYKTARQRMIEIVNDLPASDYTPSVPALYEAAHYWRGDNVVFGKNRANQASSRISHAGSYCTAANSCNGADTSNYPPYGVNTPSGCDTSVNPNNSVCKTESIQGSPKYISPFNSTLSCAKNYQVFLTDGAANVNSVQNSIRSEYLGNAACLTTNGLGNPYSSSESCGVDLVKFLYEKDQSSTLDNTQNVLTYTIAFNLTDTDSTQWLKDMASAGSGGSNDAFFSATNATDLVSAFNTILTDVKKDPTSFVAPSLATNAFNRLLSRDEVYFGLFTPALNKGWFGNVKKYKICVDSAGADGIPGNSDDCTLGTILDATGINAVGSADNKFLDTAQSYWSNAVDGRATTKGGSGGEITDYTTRTIYTESNVMPTTPTPLSGAGYVLNSGNWNALETSYVRDVVCPTNSTDTLTTAGQDCQNRYLWMLGKVINPDADTDTSTSPNPTRWAVNDVLHSSPSVITYGGSGGTFYDKVVVGTNDGALHFINANNSTATGGKEEWSYMPYSALSNQQQLYSNPEGNHIYGLDLTPTVLSIDNNGDGTIDPGTGALDKVYVYMGMRRGGNQVYALDVTPAAMMTSVNDTVVPKFQWRITGGSADFPRLGYTFSQPRLATIRTVDASNVPVIKTVLIFGGGYDTALDSGFGTAPTSGANNLGNALYIVDPVTGALILSIAGDDGNPLTQAANIEVPNMKYSVPGRISIGDSDGDGIDDRLYFGDTGGQVWRVDLGSNIKPSDQGVSGGNPGGTTVVGRLAAISTAGTATAERRFFEPPSIVPVRDTVYSDAASGEYDYVLIGSGNRAHPLDAAVNDRFYAFRDKNIGVMTDANNDHLADSYPQGTSPAGTAIGNGDLIDVTSQILDASDSTHVASLGWFFDFTSGGNTGEKVLSAPLTLAGTVFFTTYEPSASNNLDACAAQIGGGSAYEFNILNAAATLDWNLDGAVNALTDRSRSLGGGIPSDVVPVFTKEGIVGIVGIEGGAAQLGTLSALPRFRTYWYRENQS